MAFVVTQLCKDCVDTGGRGVFTEECFYQTKEVSAETPNMLYISP